MTDVDPIVRTSFIGTAVFVVSATLGVVGPEPVRLASAVVAGVLFLVGCVAFVSGFLAGIARSRTEEVEVIGLFFLTGSAPQPIRRKLRGLLAVQVVVAFTTAGLRPFTESAFGVLVPMFGLGLMALWGGRHGEFVPKDQVQPVED